MNFIGGESEKHIAGKCWLFIQEVRKSGRLARSQAFVWSPWDEKPFPLASWGLLDTLFPRWASLCSSLQWHFHKTLSLWFQLGLCVADCTLIDFQRLCCCCFSRILVLRIPVRYALEVKKELCFFHLYPSRNIQEQLCFHLDYIWGFS